MGDENYWRDKAEEYHDALQAIDLTAADVETLSREFAKTCREKDGLLAALESELAETKAEIERLRAGILTEREGDSSMVFTLCVPVTVTGVENIRTQAKLVNTALAQVEEALTHPEQATQEPGDE